MKKILTVVSLLLVMSTACYGAVSEDMGVYVRKDVYEVYMRNMNANMERIISHMWKGIRSHNSNHFIPIFPQGKFERSTGEMEMWRTSRPHHETQKSHINICTFDSTWEASTAYQLDHNENVQAWAKNDHLGFIVRYSYGGMTRRYLPDFLVRLMNGKMLVLEVKGNETEQDKAKHEALRDWCEAVNTVKTYGEWACDVSYNPADVDGIILRHMEG